MKPSTTGNVGIYRYDHPSGGWGSAKSLLRNTTEQGLFLSDTAFDIPEGNGAGCYPELNPMMPLWPHERRAHVTVAKSVPVRVMAQERETPACTAATS